MFFHQWKSKEKVQACLELLGEVGTTLRDVATTQQSQPDEVRDYGNSLQLLRDIYSNYRIALGVILWQRHVDRYNPWQVFTFGHETEVRLTEDYLEAIISQVLARAMPDSIGLGGAPHVDVMSPDPSSPIHRDLLKIEFAARIDLDQARFEGTVSLFGLVSFATSHAGRFILYCMPRLDFKGAPLDVIYEQSQNIEKSLRSQPMFDASMLSKLADLRILGCQANEEYSLFGVRAGHQPSKHIYGHVFTHSPIPPQYDFSIKIPSMAYVQAVYAENGGSIFSQGFVRNPHSDGTRYAYLFGVKYKVDIDADVDLGCFGRFQARYRRDIYINCLLSFEVELSNGVAKLQSVVRTQSDLAERSRATIREMPNIASADVTMAKQGEIEFLIKEA